MNRIILFVTLIFCMLMIEGCGFKGSQYKEDVPQYAGTYIDEFGNRFTLRDNHTGTIQFAGSDKISDITWNEPLRAEHRFATISYNGDSCYYYLTNGYLYRHQEDMNSQRCPIMIERIEEDSK